MCEVHLVNRNLDYSDASISLKNFGVDILEDSHCTIRHSSSNYICWFSAIALILNNEAASFELTGVYLVAFY